MASNNGCYNGAVPDIRKPAPIVIDNILEWFFRFAASGWVPPRWFAPDYSKLPPVRPAKELLTIEIVSHCWNYANILSYQLSSLVLHPPEKTNIIMTVFYEESDHRTREVLKYFSSQKPEKVQWNFCCLNKSYLLRRAIGRNLAALNTKADWIFFTDCDLLFREKSLDLLAGELAQRSELLVYPRQHMITELLDDDDELFTDYKQAGMVRDIDPDRFYVEERDRATGALQITRSDAAHLGGYCGTVGYYQRPAKKWRKCYEDRSFRWLLGTQGTPIDVPGFYRIRHATKGRKGKTVGGG
ncbi:MAG: glycosyltransferase family A protein [Bacteroidales bacterium]|nr:glycosyltransferase family A protein [Bacteroidales bacterium]